MRPKLFLRADGDSLTGLGHVYRTLALAEICKEFFECIFLTSRSSSAIASIVGETCRVMVMDADINVAASKNEMPPTDRNDIIVLDGYQFDTAFQEAVRSIQGCKLVSVDDIHACRFVSDLVINHAGGITAEKYNTSDSTKVLAGPGYAILRRPFYNKTLKREPANKVGHLLICFGGADPDNHTMDTLKQIHEVDALLKVSVVVGAAYRHSDALDGYCADRDTVTVHKSLDVEAMVRLMGECDTAICSSSTIAYEYCSVTGLLFVKKTADNQNDIHAFLLNNGLALPLERFAEICQSENIAGAREQLISHQTKYFDHKAGQRVLKAFKQLYLRDNIVIRRATATDVDQYFSWANDEAVRRESFNTAPIGYEEHCKWFASNLSCPDAVMYVVATGSGIPAGSIRFKINASTAELSYLVDPLFRIAGLGEVILRDGAAALFNERKDVDVIEGLVKDTNIASLKAFYAAGYVAVANNEKGVHRFQLKR